MVVSFSQACSIFALPFLIHGFPTSLSEMRSDDLYKFPALAAEVTCVDCAEYVALTAEQKFQVLWKKINSDPYPPDNLPTNYPDILRVTFMDLRRIAWNGSMPYLFDRFSDENPTEHAKIIHSFGSVAGVRFVPSTAANEMGFTGMFKDGFKYGFLRLSIVASWTSACKDGIDFNFQGCFKPSMALKMLRDKDYSSNTVAQVNLGDGVGQDFNFFNHTHATWLPMPFSSGAGVVKHFFSYASEYAEVGGVGLEQLASQGSKANQPKSDIHAPTMVYFRPHKDMRGRFTSNLHDVRRDWVKIDPGTTLYDVVAVDGPGCAVTKSRRNLYTHFRKVHWVDPVPAQDLESSTCKHAVVGHLQTTTKFMASSYGDRRLFFQHERFKTKGGKWKRQACESTGGALPSQSVYRMPDNHKKVCTQTCPSGTKPAPLESCPFANLS